MSLKQRPINRGSPEAVGSEIPHSLMTWTVADPWSDTAHNNQTSSSQRRVQQTVRV